MKSTVTILLFILWIVISTLVFCICQDYAWSAFNEKSLNEDIAYSLIGWFFFFVDLLLIGGLMDLSQNKTP